MNKIFLTVMSIVLFVGAPAISFAQGSKEAKGSMMGAEEKGSMMGGEGMMMHKTGMMEMCRRHWMMTGKSLAPTEDGGVIVMMGNKLFKYDKDLELKKEAEIKIDTEGMSKWMAQIEKTCPMYGKMTKGTSGKEAN